MSDAQVPEWLGRLADATKHIAELERIIGKQEEELHQKELRVAELEAKLKWAMGLNACIEHERAERAEALNQKHLSEIGRLDGVVSELEAEAAGYKDGAQRLIESNTRLLKRAEQAEAENEIVAHAVSELCIFMGVEDLDELESAIVVLTNRALEAEAELAEMAERAVWHSNKRMELEAENGRWKDLYMKAVEGNHPTEHYYQMTAHLREKYRAELEALKAREPSEVEYECARYRHLYEAESRIRKAQDKELAALKAELDRIDPSRLVDRGEA